LAELYLRAGAIDLAQEEAQEVLKRQPQSIQANLILGNAYFNKRNGVRAQHYFGEIIRIAPANPIGYFHMGRTLLAQRRNSEALTQFEKALSIQPNFLEALQSIVAIHISQKETRKAIGRVEAQIKTSPGNPFFYNLLGSVHESNKDKSQAEENYKKAIDLNPNIAGFYISLGNFYRRQNMAQMAIEKYKTAIQKDRNSLPAHMSLGIIYEMQKQFDQAKEYYQKALKINPRFLPAANNLAYLYADQGGNIDEALNLAQMAKGQAPEDPHISDTLGWIYYKKNIYPRAIVYLKEANEKISKHPILQYHLGMAYYKNGDRELAKRELERALKLDPKFPGSEEARETLKKLE
jgi:tetratricopeptide (TPR) repeat protein